MIEQWKPITGWEDTYAVSSLGRFKNIKRGKLRKTRQSEWGYHQIVLTRNGKQTALMAHKVVAQEFLGFSDLDVNHKDGVKSNNAVSNLEWTTKSENMQHAMSTGLWNPVGENNANATLTPSIVHWVKYALGQGAVCARLASVLGVQRSAISKIKLGRSWSHV